MRVIVVDSIQRSGRLMREKLDGGDSNATRASSAFDQIEAGGDAVRIVGHGTGSRAESSTKAEQSQFRQEMARPAGFEPATLGFEARYSIQLS